MPTDTRRYATSSDAGHPHAAALSALLGTLEARDAQLLLSYVLWPDAAPLPSVVDEYVRGHPADELSSRRRRRRRADAASNELVRA